MATKQQVVSAIQKKGGKLIDNTDSWNWQVYLEAPKDHHWGDTHCRNLHWYPSGSKPAFWNMVLDEIKELEATPCEDDPWCKADFGSCEYWEEE